MHSFQFVYFFFIFFIATIYPVFIFAALYTVPNVPSPRVFIVLYFYILIIITTKCILYKLINKNKGFIIFNV